MINTDMIHRYKLTPEYFIKRAVKAKSLQELLNANLGLYNLYLRHAEYAYQQFSESMFGKPGSKVTHHDLRVTDKKFD